jgi:hypothetical protein
MRYVLMHKQDKTHELGVMPKPEFIAAMGALVGGLAKSGALKDGGGLGKSVNRTRLTFRGGERTVLDGPFTGSDNELPATLFSVTTRSRKEAVEWASRLGRVLGDVEIEVGKTTEAWDLGLAPEPQDPPFNCLFLQKATPDSEAGKAPSPAIQSAIEDLEREMRDAGVLKNVVRMAPSAQATRISMAPGKRRAVDGPFAESKELIGGFVLVEMPSHEAVLELCDRYGALMLTSVERLEIDVRPVVDD